MKKKILGFLLFGLLIFVFFQGRKKYYQYKDQQRKDAYYDNLVDTSSPTVTVLKDSILIEYQNNKRTVHIYVPPEYNQDTITHYPVIYMLDGESSFNDLANMGPEWEIDEVINQASIDGQPTAIVVGIEEAEDRDAEYTPFINEDNPNAHGDKFSQWLATDLKSLIDSNYRTLTDEQSTTIGGISRSGMMAYYILMAHPDVFGNALVQSPSMWVDHDRLMDMELSKDQLVNKKIFVSVGEYEGGIMVPHAKEVYEKFKAYGLEDDQVHFEMIMDESHWHITWRKSFAIAYPWLMK